MKDAEKVKGTTKKLAGFIVKKIREEMTAEERHRCQLGLFVKLCELAVSRSDGGEPGFLEWGISGEDRRRLETEAFLIHKLKLEGLLGSKKVRAIARRIDAKLFGDVSLQTGEILPNDFFWSIYDTCSHCNALEHKADLLVIRKRKITLCYECLDSLLDEHF